MRTPTPPVDEDTPTSVLLCECTAKTVEAVLADLRGRPIIQLEWLSPQEAAGYCGYREQQFSDFEKRGIAPPSVLFSRNAHDSSAPTSMPVMPGAAPRSSPKSSKGPMYSDCPYVVRPPTRRISK
jgi:hypothetical protein